MPNDYDSDPWIRTPKYARFGGENVMIGQLEQHFQKEHLLEFYWTV